MEKNQQIHSPSPNQSAGLAGLTFNSKSDNNGAGANGKPDLLEDIRKDDYAAIQNAKDDGND